jgi:NTP pyrophosphatase (non-canonical NTP hydrolase)
MNSVHCLRDDHRLYREVLNARRNAHRKHGENSIESQPSDSPRWMAILAEELGEVAHCLTYDGPHDELRAELIDVLAVASAWVCAIDGRHYEELTRLA